MLNPADGAFLARLEQALGPGGLRAPEPRDLEEPRGRHHGIAGAVAMPRSTAEVASVLRLCNAARVGVVPLAGGTGLVAGQVMSEGPLPLILSVERLTAIRAVSAEENALTAEAGVRLIDIRNAAEAAGRVFGLSLASEGSCRIGGNLATNAGGAQVLRYGSARDLCLGLEAVLADGSVLSGLGTLRKDNTGYDLRNLMIGSEGTLGIITAASLKLHARPHERATAWVALSDPAAAMALFEKARDWLGEDILAFELMAREGLDFLAAHLPQAPAPPLAEAPWFVLVETGGSRLARPGEALEGLLAEALEAGQVQDAAIATSLAQRQRMWEIRETIPEANRLRGAIATHDIALPLSAIAEFIDRAGRMLARMAPGVVINCFGHLGDGNLHYNVFPPQDVPAARFDDRRAAIAAAVYELVVAMGGSFSAEHGIGRDKRAQLERFGDPARLAAMAAIKRALDPNGILNPGAVLPAAEAIAPSAEAEGAEVKLDV
ncbi:MAG: FAD-binding oxidoreductase [Alphaproteobacteria bacterium]|nr:MAG: FAD-binding oxidoreductase [Alphaproteobacteria bacterium]